MKMIIFPALAVAAIVFVFIMFAYHAGVEDGVKEELKRWEEIIRSPGPWQDMKGR